MVPANCDVLSEMRFSPFHRCGGDFRRIVQLENLYQKSDKLKRHKFRTKRRKLFWWFSMHIIIFGRWHATYTYIYISAHVLQGVWISKKCAKCKNGSWPGKNTAKQLKRKFLAETAEFIEATIISLARAGGRNFNPAGRIWHTWRIFCLGMSGA